MAAGTAEGVIRIIAQLIDQVSGRAKAIEAALRRLGRTTEQVAAAQQQFPAYIPGRSMDVMKSKIREMHREMYAAQPAISQFGTFIQANEKYFRRSATTMGQFKYMAYTTAKSTSSWIASQQRNMGSLAWTFTWATLSMMGVLWNFQWMIQTFLGPLQMLVGALTDWTNVAYDVAYWLALGAMFGLDFAESFGGVGQAIQDVVQAGLFLQATVGGLLSLFVVALAKALQAPGVMEAITGAFTRLVEVFTDPQIIIALAGIVKGFAAMSETLIPKLLEMMPTIERVLDLFLRLIPVIDQNSSTFEKLGQALALLTALFMVLQPIMLPIMTLFSILSMIIVQAVVLWKALSGVVAVVNGVMSKFGWTLVETLGRLFAVAGGIFMVVKGFLNMIFYGVNLSNVLDVIIGLATIVAAILGGPLTVAIMAVIAIVKTVIDYFGWWDEIAQALIGTFNWLISVLSTIWDWLMKILSPLQTVAGLLGWGGGGAPRAAAAPAGGSAPVTVYQDVRIERVTSELDIDAALRRAAEDIAYRLRRGY